MTRSNRKKAQVTDLTIDKENDKLENIATPTKALATSKHGAFNKSHKPSTLTVAPQTQVGLLVTDELEKAMEECRTKVAQIVKGCRAANRRFRDVEFDLENDKIWCLRGLNYDGSETPPAVRRVTQIFEKPQFFIDGADAIDIIQGNLGDCWFLSALATMSTSKGLIEKLCVSRDEEVGVYGFVFFHGSSWVSVVIDDQLFWSLPKYEELSGQEQALYRRDRDTYNKLAQKGGKGLHFARSGTEGETWVPLIEKAYAKLHGDYASLSGGFPSEAIEDMTGGVSVMYRSNDIFDKDRFWKEELLHATQDRLFSCSFDGLDLSRKDYPLTEDAKINGLFGGHAYSILRVRECRGKRFVVIRNPWGNSEWTGAWGDGSKEWTSESLDILKELDHVFGDDGEFVMEYCDFLDTFELIERTTIFDSSWVMSSHWLRAPPQRPNHPWSFGDLSFKFTLNKPSFTIIALSQLDTRYFEVISGLSKWNIDFVVYKRGDKEITGVSFYAIVKARSVTSELHLEAGEYIIFPRYDRYSSEPPGYFEMQLPNWNKRKLSRVLTERARARSIANNLGDGPDDKYFPTSIEILIEEDLEKLEAAKQEIIDDDDNEDWEEEKEEEEAEEEETGSVDGPEKTGGNPENGGLGELVVPGFMGLPGPGYGYGYGYPGPEGPGEDSDDEDEDPITLGVRIYTQGGAVVSLTGQVIGEEIDEDEGDEDKNEGDEDKDEGDKDKDDDDDDDDDAKKTKDTKKKTKDAKKAKDKDKKNKQQLDV